MRFLRVFAASLLLIPSVACWNSPPMPQELVGNWVTEDPKYQGKNLIIDKDGFIVLILDAETKPKAERVDSMTGTKEAGGGTYVFETTDVAGAHRKITVSYRSANGGEVRLAHPNQVVWHRAQ